MRLEHGHSLFHHCSRLEHKRKLHLPGAKEFTHSLHSAKQVIVDDRERRVKQHGFRETLVEIAIFAVDNVPRQSFLNRKIREALLRGGVFHPIRKERNEVEQRIEAFALPLRTLGSATIKDEPFRRVPLGVGDAVLRKNLRCVHECRREPARACMVEEHRVENGAR